MTEQAKAGPSFWVPKDESPDIEVVFEKTNGVPAPAIEWEFFSTGDYNDDWPDLDLAIIASLKDTANCSSNRNQHVVNKPSTLAIVPARVPTVGLNQNPSSSIPRPMKLIDDAWELIDPTPNIHALFVEFSKEFFWDRLGGVEVKWSPRMTSCAGVCSFKPKNRECIISLSAPLLKLRPRKDLVETLLHEMIHAYLFLDTGTTDREGHGEQFHSHMYRINNRSGTKITVYHSFHDEVKHYKTHWWKCTGPCKGRPPYFGVVKRAMNRAPGPSDFWHDEHKRTCGGTFVKIREPTKDETKNGAASKGLSSSLPNEKSKKITDFFPTTPKASTDTKPKTVTTMKDITSSTTSTNTKATSLPKSSLNPHGSQYFPGKGRKLNEGNATPLLPKMRKF